MQLGKRRAVFSLLLAVQLFLFLRFAASSSIYVLFKCVSSLYLFVVTY